MNITDPVKRVNTKWHKAAYFFNLRYRCGYFATVKRGFGQKCVLVSNQLLTTQETACMKQPNR